MSDRKSLILAAMLKVDEKDFTNSGKPDVKALNLILAVNDTEPTTAKERDLYWSEFVEMSDNDPAVISGNQDATEINALATSGFATVTVTEASTDPVHLFIHGVGSFELKIGVPISIPSVAIPAMNDSDLKFTIGGDA